MKKFVLKRIVALSICIVLVVFSVGLLGASATSGGQVIDNAGLFDSLELQTISNSISTVSETEIYIVTTNDYIFGDSELKALINSDNFVALTINMNTRHYDIYTYGQAYNNITDKEITRLENAVEDKLANGDYSEAVISFIEKADKAYNGNLGPDMLFILAVSAIIAFAAALISCIIVISKYKMKMRPTNYPLDKYARMQLRDRQDIFTGNIVTTRTIQTNTSSGGGKSGGGGGGGHRGGGSF